MERLITYKAEIMIETEAGFTTVDEKVAISRFANKLGGHNAKKEREVVLERMMDKYPDAIEITIP